MTKWVNIYQSKDNRLIYFVYETKEEALRAIKVIDDKMKKPIIIAYEWEE